MAEHFLTTISRKACYDNQLFQLSSFKRVNYLHYNSLSFSCPVFFISVTMMKLMFESKCSLLKHAPLSVGCIRKFTLSIIFGSYYNELIILK